MRGAARGLIVVFIFLNHSNVALAAEATPRRQFMQQLGSFGLLGVGMASGSAAATVLDVVARPEGPTYTKTVFEQHLYLIGEIVTTRLLTMVYGEGTFGNASMDAKKIEELLEDPVSMWKWLTIVAPTVEEAIFRLFPSAIFGTNWVAGTASAAAFAAVHGLEKIPIGQFAGGIWFWYLMKHRGISHAIVAHAANNNAAAVGLILAKRLNVLFPDVTKSCAPRLDQSSFKVSSRAE